MAGGVWEWTTDVRETSDGAMGVLKGGSWRSRSPADLRAATETEAPPEDPDAEMGVRCVR
jgi:formylglycine-generating enzyme required for sulfatase activity